MPDRVPPLTDVRELSHLAYGFMASKALFAALDLDLFSALSGGAKSLESLETATGVPGNRLSTLLAALVAVGLVQHEDDLFVNAPVAARYLVRGGSNYFGDYYRLQIDKQVYPSWQQLRDGLIGLPTKSIYDLIQDEREAELFSHAQHQGSTGPAILLSRVVDLKGCSRLLDVAGGTGAFSIVLCRLYPELRSTILDFPAVTEVARRYVDEAGLADRVEFLSGNALEREWPNGQDAVLMSYLLSAVGASDIERLMERARNALKPGGLLILHDFMLNADRAGPRDAALFLLGTVTIRPDAMSFSAEDLDEMSRRHGFTSVSLQVLIPETTKLVVARLGAGT
jgi:2-hydroxy-4-(methylsulfanyl)butanoate S-methyltransferase